MQVTIDVNARRQVIRGFGASGAWWAQAVGGWTNTEPDGTPVRERICRLLYDPEDGIGLNIYRYNLGAGSAGRADGDIGDPLRRAESFLRDDGSLDFSRDANAVRMLRLCCAAGADTVVFFVNSPPVQMTKNGLAHLRKNETFRTNLARERVEEFCAYVLDCAAHFIAEGVPVKFVSPVNEPFWVWNGGQEGCHYSPAQAKRVLRAMGAQMAARTDLGGLQISGCENGDIRWRNRGFTRAALDASVAGYVDGVDVHSYFLPFPLPGFNDRARFLRRYRRWLDRRFPDAEVNMSEWCHMTGGRDASMVSALETARVMHEDLTLLNVSTWQHWIACSPYDYCDGLLYIDPEKQTFEKTKRYYVTGNFSKYVRPGSVRVDARCDEADVRVTAFERDGAVTLVLINPVNRAFTFTADRDARTALTDEGHGLFESRAAKGDSIGLPPRSVLTVRYEVDA